jgi:hypothetical protein
LVNGFLREASFISYIGDRGLAIVEAKPAA